MGCSTSKLDSFPAVSLCCDRCNFLSSALRHSYDIADANAAYSRSLTAVGDSLRRFFDESAAASVYDATPTAASGEMKEVSPDSSSADTDSHPKFDTDSESNDDEDETYRKGDFLDYTEHETLISDGHPFMPVDYMKNRPTTQSLSYSYYDSGGRTPPPPPPAPSSSSWDFFNFFESYELTYAERQGKEFNNQPEEHGSVKESRSELNSDGKQAKIARKEERRIRRKDSEAGKEADPEKEKARGNDESSELKSENDVRGVAEVMREIQELFDKASEAGNEVSKVLDTAKFRYFHRSSVYQVSANILHAVSPSFLGVYSPSSKKTGLLNPDFEEDFGVNFSNLSSTLNKLCMWEKKLYHEVKAEEKLRTVHAKNYKHLKRLEEKGADIRKVESTRTLVRSLSTRMTVSVHTIDKISITINKLRDEELWPRIKELIHRLFEMWKAMLECYSCQTRIISKASILESISLNAKLENSVLVLALNLKAELRNWNRSLSIWIEAQRCFVKALNGWLLRCLLHDPHETPDHIVPAGAPPVFVIINQWSLAVDRLSEKEVAEATYRCLVCINNMVEKHKVEMQEKSLADKDLERKMLVLEKEEQKMQKKMNFSGESPENTNLKSNLEQIFASMERFAGNSRQVYEELDASVMH